MREFTWHERQFVALVIGGIPALIIGLILGFWGTGIGGREIDLSTVLLRGAYCSIFPTLLSFLTPRSWGLPALAYLFGFSMSFGIPDVFKVLPELIMIPVRWMEGKRMINSPPHAHPDLPWILGIALWLAGLVSILRQSNRFVAWIRRLEITPEAGDNTGSGEERS